MIGVIKACYLAIMTLFYKKYGRLIIENPVEIEELNYKISNGF